MTRATAATILIVDDESTNRKLLETMLRPEGYVTLTCSTGQQAFDLVAQEAPDLILLDIMLPDMDGYQVAVRLKADPASASIPIIMVTAKHDRIARLNGLNAGAEDFLTKPVERAELWLRVRNLLRLKALGDVLQNHSAILEEQVHARTESLVASELRFRQMADNISEVFFLRVTESGRFLYVSPAYEQIWGRSCESLYANAQSWDDSIYPDDRPKAREKHDSLPLRGKFENEYRIVRPDGTIRWIDYKGFAVRNDAGTIVRVAGVAEDVTDSRRAALDLRESERRFSDMLANVDLISLMLDRDQRITYCNDYLLRLTGWRREEIMGRDWLDLFIPPETEGVRESFTALLSDAPLARHRESEILTRAGGRRLIRWNNSVLRSGAGDVVGTASIGEDITERRMAGEVLEKRAAELERFHRLSVGRELQMIELKKQVNEWSNKAGHASPYDLAFLSPEGPKT